MSATKKKSIKPSSLRLWPAFLVTVAAAVRVVWIWNAPASQRQERILGTILAIVLAVLLLTLWLAFFSRLAWKTRGIVLGILALVAVALGVSFRIEGTTGDLLPILKLRFSRAPEPTATPAPVATERERDPGVDGAGYPGFFGPHRNGVLSGPRLARDWSTTAPEVVFRIPVGPAWSGFAVLGTRAITQEQLGEDEAVNCYDLTSGRLLWSHSDKARHEDPLGGVGPRATPSIVDDRVYTLGATGVLNVLDLASGETIWSRDLFDDSRASRPEYGVSASPLVLEDHVVVMAGGAGSSILAYDRLTGEQAWRGGDDPAGYGSPVLLDLAGTPQIVVLNGSAVVGHSPDDGRVLWRFPWPGQTPHASQPVLLPDDRLFVSTGYGVGAKLLRVTAASGGEWTVDLVWESLGLKTKFTSAVPLDGVLYGLDDGVLVALDQSDGARHWKRGRYGHGQLILVDDMLVISAEDGDIALVEATPTAFHEGGRMPALSGRTWNSPAIAGRYLLVRNDHEAVCLALPLAD